MKLLIPALLFVSFSSAAVDMSCDLYTGVISNGSVDESTVSVSSETATVYDYGSDFSVIFAGKMLRSGKLDAKGYGSIGDQLFSADRAKKRYTSIIGQFIVVADCNK